MIDKIPFGSTGHLSSRILFGAAALGGMRQEKADGILSMVLEYGINHIDVAASYGDAELRLAPFLQDHRSEVFLATKTGDRSRDGAMASIERSLERMQVDQLDLIQFHNLAKEADWQQAMGKDGALTAAIQAREQGLVRYIGVTGHGTHIADMHLKSLAQFDFASILLPYSHTSMLDPAYAASFEKLYQLCQDKGVAIQTIKAIARRRWREDDDSKRFSWYEPIREEAALRRAIYWVFRRPGLFLNSSSDATLLKMIFEAAADFDANELEGIETAVAADVEALGQEPLFIRDVIDDVV
jgi:aryl-alcohol dehydrogenase-like predicted oxidoreductase